MATYSANTAYNYTNQIAGSFSGGAWTAALGNVPHPTNITYSHSSSGDTVIDYSAVLIGSGGLNN